MYIYIYIYMDVWYIASSSTNKKLYGGVLSHGGPPKSIPFAENSPANKPSRSIQLLGYPIMVWETSTGAQALETLSRTFVTG